jgi:ribosome-associated toxin RatA of RatAB toxin-antitoxin module
MAFERGKWAGVAVALAVAVAPLGAALAGPSDVALRLMKKRDAERYEKEYPGASIKAGCARISVKASVDIVKQVVTDYRHYQQFIKKFEKAKVVGRSGEKTDVYLEVPILKGAAKIWAVVRFEPPKQVGSEHVIEARLVKGNIDRFDARWRISKIDDNNSQLDLELLIVPKLPVPGKLVTGEVAYASDVSVTGARDRAEQKTAEQ